MLSVHLNVLKRELVISSEKWQIVSAEFWKSLKYVSCIIIMQCRSKGDVSGGAHKRWRREPLGGSGGMLPPKILKSSRRLGNAISSVLQDLFVIYAYRELFTSYSKPMHIESITLAMSITK